MATTPSSVLRRLLPTQGNPTPPLLPKLPPDTRFLPTLVLFWTCQPSGKEATPDSVPRSSQPPWPWSSGPLTPAAPPFLFPVPSLRPLSGPSSFPVLPLTQCQLPQHQPPPKSPSRAAWRPHPGSPPQHAPLLRLRGGLGGGPLRHPPLQGQLPSHCHGASPRVPATESFPCPGFSPTGLPPGSFCGAHLRPPVAHTPATSPEPASSRGAPLALVPSTPSPAPEAVSVSCGQSGRSLPSGPRRRLPQGLAGASPQGLSAVSSPLTLVPPAASSQALVPSAASPRTLVPQSPPLKLWCPRRPPLGPLLQPPLPWALAQCLYARVKHL